MLRGSHLVVVGVDGETESKELCLHVLQESANTQRRATEIVSFGLLTTVWHSAQQSATAGDEVRALLVHFAVNDEELLLPANVGDLKPA
jgi:hypothetical protein